MLRIRIFRWAARWIYATRKFIWMLTRVITINNNMDINNIQHQIWQHNQMLIPLLYITAQCTVTDYPQSFSMFCYRVNIRTVELLHHIQKPNLIREHVSAHQQFLYVRPTLFKLKERYYIVQEPKFWNFQTRLWLFNAGLTTLCDQQWQIIVALCFIFRPKSVKINIRFVDLSLYYLTNL